MNLYATLREFKQQLLRDTTETDNDDLYLDYLELSSRIIDHYCGGEEQWRQFYTHKAEKTLRPEVRGADIFNPTFNSTVTAYYRRGTGSLIIPDLLEVESIKIGDSDVTDSFHLEPRNNYPKVQIVTKRSNVWAFTSLFSNVIRDDVDVVIDGKWGYSDVRSPNALSTLETDVDNEATEFDVDDVSKLSVGMNLWIGSGSSEEQCYLQSIEQDNDDDENAPIPGTLTVVRGFNGYPKASHDANDKIYSQRIAAPIRQSCIDLAILKHRGRDVEWEGQGSENEGLSELMNPIAIQIKHYRRGRMRFYGL